MALRTLALRTISLKTMSLRTMVLRENNIIVIVSALLAFFATLSGMLIILEPRPISVVTPVPIVVTLPDVAAAPPVLTQRSVAPVPHLRHIEWTLKELGVDCAYGDCYPDS